MMAAVCLMCLFAVQSASNKAISLEEAVYTAASDIKVEEEARVGKVINLADRVKETVCHGWQDTVRTIEYYLTQLESV